MSNPDHCWTIVSVPEELEPLPWVLNNIASPIVKANKWENLPEGFKLLKLDKMDGKNLLLMAALS